MQSDQQAEYAAQRRLIYALVANLQNRPPASGVRLLETHISWILLFGRHAYKIKKAVNLGFLDFSSLQARRFYCEEEIRLNRRLAPKIYLDVIAIGGNPENPVLGEYPAIEYAVRMRRFPRTKQLDKLATRNKLLPQHIDGLAASVAQFHLRLPVSEDNSPFGTPDAVYKDAAQNFEHLQALLTDSKDLERLATLRRASDSEFEQCRSLFAQRRTQGFVRECHGDLHLGNIVLIGEQPVPFDGIEFNPALRWIDVISEIAFTVMDLLYHRRTDFAWRFLNAYLEITGDYAGVKLLRFYVAYRAMVRAKVSAITASQTELGTKEKAAAWNACRDYMALAEQSLARKKSALILTHGLPGSGKSTFAQLALARLQAVRLRSDVERKRLFGLDPLADSRASTGMNLYASDISKRTYAHLYALANELLTAGMTVIVDATFLKHEEREHFHQLAGRLGIPFVIASVQSGDATLRARITQRQRAENDASEADIAVLEKLQKTQEILSPEESDYTAVFVNEASGIVESSEGWNRLKQLLDLQRQT